MAHFEPRDIGNGIQWPRSAFKRNTQLTSARREQRHGGE
jgi:hypothetical protein